MECVVELCCSSVINELLEVEVCFVFASLALFSFAGHSHSIYHSGVDQLGIPYIYIVNTI